MAKLRTTGFGQTTNVIRPEAWALSAMFMICRWMTDAERQQQTELRSLSADAREPAGDPEETFTATTDVSSSGARGKVRFRRPVALNGVK